MNVEKVLLSAIRLQDVKSKILLLLDIHISCTYNWLFGNCDEIFDIVVLMLLKCIEQNVHDFFSVLSKPLFHFVFVRCWSLKQTTSKCRGALAYFH